MTLVRASECEARPSEPDGWPIDSAHVHTPAGQVTNNSSGRQSRRGVHLVPVGPRYGIEWCMPSYRLGVSCHRRASGSAGTRLSVAKTSTPGRCLGTVNECMGQGTPIDVLSEPSACRTGSELASVVSNPSLVPDRSAYGPSNRMLFVFAFATIRGGKTL